MHVQAIIPAFLTSNIYIGLCNSKAPTLTWLRSFDTFEVLLIVRINRSVGLRGIMNFRLLRDAFPGKVGNRVSSQGVSSVPSTIQCHNVTLSSSLNNSRVADIDQHATSTPSATQRRWMNSQTAILGTSSRSTLASGATSTRNVVSSPGDNY